MTGLPIRGKRHLSEMTALDAMLCMEHANEVDPFRGPKWLEAFDAHARKLGYRDSAYGVCRCPELPHRPECQMVRTTVYPPVPVFPHADSFDPNSPADGILVVGNSFWIYPHYRPENRV